MDGVFVPNLTIGPDIVKSCRSFADIVFEAHLMVVNADEMAPLYVEAGCEVVMVHVEACTHLHRSLANIQSLGAKSGVVLNPHTPASSIEHVLDVTDHVLIMTVNPGFGGQAYIPLLSKIEAIKAMVDAGGHDIDIEVDGGINARRSKSALQPVRTSSSAARRSSVTTTGQPASPNSRATPRPHARELLRRAPSSTPGPLRLAGARRHAPGHHRPARTR